MRRHKKKHSKEAPYKCSYCPYTCIQSTLFASHMISKHSDVSHNNVFKCPYCKFKSISRDKYVSHLSSMHTDKEGIQVLIETTSNSNIKASKPSWTIPSVITQDTTIESGKIEINITSIPQENVEDAHIETSNNIAIELDDCDSQQERLPTNYSTTNDAQININRQDVTDLSKEDINSDCLMSESSNDTTIERHQYAPQIELQNMNYASTEEYMNTSVSIGQSLLQCNNVNALASNTSSLINNTINNNILNNFPIRLPPIPQISVRKNITLTPIDRIPIPKVTGPIIKPTQILPVPSLSNSPVNNVVEPEGAPRKKPKISVKSNLILKGPDQVDMFHSQQKMAFKRLEDNERFGLNDPVTFNNLITTQFMQIPPEPVLSESPNNMMPYPQETMMNTPNPTNINDNSQIFNFNPPIDSMNLMPQQKTQTNNPNYIKVECSIKQNTQSPSLERMCSANALINSQALNRDYKASPPLEDISKNIGEIKNEVKSDAFYNMALNNTAGNAHIMDPYLIENIIEQYPGHLDLSNVVLQEQMSNLDDQQNDVIEIDDNSDDNKLLPRFDMNYALDSLYLMNNDFHFLDNDISPNNLSTDTNNEINRKVTEVPIINENKAIVNQITEVPNNEYANFIHDKSDPIMNNAIRLTTNKINVKNIELMKN